MARQLRSLQGDVQRAPGQSVSRRARTWGSGAERRILQAGEHLFQAGEFHCEAFVIRSGRLKSYRLHRDGEEQVLGMHGPGDAIGFDALIGKPAGCSVVALEIASVESIALDHSALSAMLSAAGIAGLVEGMYEEMLRQSRLLYIDRHPADRRLAEFLMDFSRSEALRGRSCTDLMLPFNRRDLACFLGLAPETLSRAFGRLQDQGTLSVENRAIRVNDHDALKKAAGE